MDIIFQIVILILSVVIHEVAHGYAALWLGDPTAKYEGRLTLNPVNHLDPFGSVLLPALLWFATNGGFVFGYARPVPYNPYNLKNRRWGEPLVALAGPISNIIVALFFVAILHFGASGLIPLSESFVAISVMIIVINLILAVFNLIPVPPLDGSKVLFALLPQHRQDIRIFLERWGFMILVFFLIFFANDVIAPIVYGLLGFLLPF